MNKAKVFENELTWINDDNIREFALIAISGLPDYFFKVPASSTGKYHPPYALGDGGLVRHTKAALMIAKEMLNLEMFAKKYDKYDQDLIYVAIMLHDGWKHGRSYSKYTVTEHPTVAADYAVEVNHDLGILTAEQIEKLHGMIASHMGQWCTDRYKNEVLPKPKTSIQSFVHLCDYLASRKFLLFDFGSDSYNPNNFN